MLFPYFQGCVTASTVPTVASKLTPHTIDVVLQNINFLFKER